MSGGGGGGQNYANLDALYGIQTDQAKRLMGLSEELVYPQYRDLAQQANDYDSFDNRERQAATAGADAAAASDRDRRAMMDDLTSYGINPGDQRFMTGANIASLQGTAQSAAARTKARDNVSQTGFARGLDVAGMLSGTPTQATTAANSAMQGAGASVNAGVQREASNNQAIGDSVRGGVNLAKFFAAADGGQVPYFESGGYVQRLARGGIVGGLRMTPPTPPQQMPASASIGNQLAGSLGMPIATGAPALSQGISAAGTAMNSPGMVAFGNGMKLKPGADPAVQQFFASPDTIANQMAMRQVDAALAGAETGASAAGVGAEVGAAAAGAEAVGGAAAAEAVGGAVAAEAAGTGLASLGAAGTALGAAMPWVGGAMLLGSALGMFKDGGAVNRRVTPGSDGSKGGPVDGPGGPKDDRVPALLSAGEFVLPVGTVKKYGLAKLEKMRAEGLDFEKQLGIGRA